MMLKEHTDNALSKFLIIFKNRTQTRFHLSMKVFYNWKQPRHKWRSTGASVSVTDSGKETLREGFPLAPSNHIMLSHTSFLHGGCHLTKSVVFRYLWHGLKRWLGNFPLEIVGPLLVKIMLREGSDDQFSDSLKASITVWYINLSRRYLCGKTKHALDFFQATTY